MTTDARNGLKLGPLLFLPEVTAGNIASVIYVAFITIAMLGFIGFVQPFILTEVLQIPKNEQGVLTGTLILMQEIIVVTCISFSGALSDKFGRRIIIVAGFFFLGIGYFLYPMATSVEQLYGTRAVFALGVAVAPIVLTACVVDLIDERSRGRWVGFIGLLTSCGAVFMALVLSRMPQGFLEAGFTAINAARFSYWIAAVTCLLTVVILWFGMRGSILTKPSIDQKNKSPTIFRRVVRGIKAGAENPRLAVALFGGFVGRGDVAIVGAFLSLWIVQVGLEQGLSTSEALSYAGRIFGLIQLSSMAWSVCMGFISDRMSRVSALALAGLLAAFGYTALSLIDDPFATSMLFVAVLAGIGDISVTIAASSLMGQQAPSNERGAISGLYGVLSALGIAIVSYLGGLLFDNVSWQGPFMLMVVVNLLLAFAAVVVEFRTPKELDKLTITAQVNLRRFCGSARGRPSDAGEFSGGDQRGCN